MSITQPPSPPLHKAPAPAASPLVPPAPSTPDGPDDLVLNPRKMKFRNISFDLAALFLWTCVRFLHIRVFHGSHGEFLKFDVFFIVFPPVAAFFLNWYWLRKLHTDIMTKWSLSWAAIDLVAFTLIVTFLSSYMHQWLSML